MSPLPPSRGTSWSRSFDGYIRLTFDTFSNLDFRQKRAWEDTELRDELVQEDVPAFRAGYCEWATEDAPDPVSIGWAWFRLANGRTFLAPGGISSNVMFVAPASHDLGTHRTQELLHAWLTGENWELDTALSIPALHRPMPHRFLS